MHHFVNISAACRRAAPALLVILSLAGGAEAQTAASIASTKGSLALRGGGVVQPLIGGGSGGTSILKSNPAEKFAVAQGAVDMRTMRYVYHEIDLSTESFALGSSREGGGRPQP